MILLLCKRKGFGDYMGFIPQGLQAIMNGQILPKRLGLLFEHSGYEVVSYAEYQEMDTLPSKLAIKGFPYRSIYGHERRSTFLLMNQIQEREIRIECKWQEKPGSVEEKFVFLYVDCVRSHKEPESILVIGGDGSKSGARRWLKQVAGERWLLEGNREKDIRVMTPEEFIEYFLDNLL